MGSISNYCAVIGGPSSPGKLLAISMSPSRSAPSMVDPGRFDPRSAVIAVPGLDPGIDTTIHLLERSCELDGPAGQARGRRSSKPDRQWVNFSGTCGRAVGIISRTERAKRDRTPMHGLARRLHSAFYLNLFHLENSSIGRTTRYIRRSWMRALSGARHRPAHPKAASPRSDRRCRNPR
jgi:hypothetical protein